MLTTIHIFATVAEASAFAAGVSYASDAEALTVEHLPASCQVFTHDRDGETVDSCMIDYTRHDSTGDPIHIPAYPDLDANGFERI